MLSFLLANWIMVAIAIISGGLLLGDSILAMFDTCPAVDTAQATQLINRERAILIDVREPEEVLTGKIRNARLIPLAKLESELNALKKFKDRPVILICASGNRAKTACKLLLKNEFTRAVVLKDGIAGWKKDQLPLENISSEKA